MIDAIVVGGGLAGCLVALTLRRTRPGLTLRLLERGSEPCGDHTWSFHATDLSEQQRRLVNPLVAGSWPGYRVRFPSFERRLPGGYFALTSARLREAVRAELGQELLTEVEVRVVAADGVTLADGRRLEARCILDARGHAAPFPVPVGYQKFLGRTLLLGSDSGLTEPLLMDATLPQTDGFRFLYVLPFSEREVLIEDTYYSDSPALDREMLGAGIMELAERRGWSVREVLSEEAGVLPIPLDGSAAAFQGTAPGAVARIGMRGGLFHATTGYSLPEALRTAEALAALPELEGAAAARLVRQRAEALWRRGRFLRLLNRMLFQAAEPPLRFRVLERFYRLPAPLIERFYADRLTTWDRLRILSGRPPVPLLRAARSALGVRAA